VEREVRKVIVSDMAIDSLEQVYIYGIETFAYKAATVFIDELYERIAELSFDFLLHPECRFLKTKSRMYHNLIHGNYLVIYRIQEHHIEVLNIIHGSRSVRAIKSSRKIKL
jgi:toxin ParE1/3/4